MAWLPSVNVARNAIRCTPLKLLELPCAGGMALSRLIFRSCLVVPPTDMGSRVRAKSTSVPSLAVAHRPRLFFGVTPGPEIVARKFGPAVGPDGSAKLTNFSHVV